MKSKLKEIVPENLRRRFRLLQSFLAAAYYGFPAKKLKLIGVTGTSGKSTTTNIIFHVLNENGYRVGMISTTGARAGDKYLDTGFHVTTPDPIDFQRLLKFMVDKRIEYVIVEASSHALAQGRLGNSKFENSVYTNIKKDHLDWHKTWENYAEAKALLALSTKKSGTVIINRDDKESYAFLTSYIKQNKPGLNVVSYSFKELVDPKETIEGLHFVFAGHKYFVPIFGVHNIENALATLNLMVAMGLDESQIEKGFSTFKGIKGRMEVMQKEPFWIIVDFAHNTDSLRKSLISAKKLAKPGRKLINVFGSAGLRDVEKRYTMGETSAELADITVITAEDPRIEKLEDINNQILEGTQKGGGKLVERFKNLEEMEAWLMKNGKATVPNKSVFVFDEESVESRFGAIDFAIRIAKEGDVIITEGKGHEESLAFGTTEYPFSDQEAVRRSLDKLQVH